MSRRSVLAEAVKDGLNAQFSPGTFTAVRAYRPLFELKDFKTLTVVVIAPEYKVSRESRSTNQDLITIDVVLYKQVDPTDNAVCDALDDITEDVVEYFKDRTFGNARQIGDPEVTPYDMDDIVESRVYTAMVRVYFYIEYT